jgi:hypothetical protein
MVAFEINPAFSTKMSDPKWLSDASFVLDVINSHDVFKHQFVCSCKECGDELRESGWPVAAEVCDQIVPGWPYPSGNGDDKFGGETGGETGGDNGDGNGGETGGEAGGCPPKYTGDTTEYHKYGTETCFTTNCWGEFNELNTLLDVYHQNGSQALQDEPTFHGSKLQMCCTAMESTGEVVKDWNGSDTVQNPLANGNCKILKGLGLNQNP